MCFCSSQRVNILVFINHICFNYFTVLLATKMGNTVYVVRTIFIYLLLIPIRQATVRARQPRKRWVDSSF